MRKILTGAVLWTVLAVCNLIWRPHDSQHLVTYWVITGGSCILSVMKWGDFIRERRSSKSPNPPVA